MMTEGLLCGSRGHGAVQIGPNRRHLGLQDALILICLTPIPQIEIKTSQVCQSASRPELSQNEGSVCSVMVFTEFDIALLECR